MRKSRFTEEQMVRILRETDKGAVADVAKKHGVSEQTIYQWRKKFGAMDVDDAKRLKTEGRPEPLATEVPAENMGQACSSGPTNRDGDSNLWAA